MPHDDESGSDARRCGSLGTESPPCGLEATGRLCCAGVAVGRRERGFWDLPDMDCVADHIGGAFLASEALRILTRHHRLWLPI
jgi:hypothetical protein